VARSAAGQHAGHHFRRQHALGNASLPGIFPGKQLSACRKAVALQQGIDPADPDLVIACREIIGRPDIFAGMPALVDAPGTESTQGERDAERPLLPVAMEAGLVRFGRDGAETHLTAEIVRSVHAASSGWRAIAVPIIASRLTSPASSSSPNPTVPS